MEHKKEKIVYIVIVLIGLFTIVVGSSYAYYTSTINTVNEENKTSKIEAATIVDVTLDYGNKIEANGVMPGYKVIKTIHITGRGEASAKPTTMSITLTPEVKDFKNHIQYSIYAVENSNIEVESLCEEPREVVESGKYYDEMECDTSLLGNKIKSGIFVDQEEVEEKVKVEYNTNRTYYVLVEYLNDEENDQNSEQGKSFQIHIDYKGSSEEKLSDYIINLSKSEESIEKIEHGATEQTPALTDYRYTGSNPNNYVYFGCSNNCTEENLYRIIGVIPTKSSEEGEYEPRVKLIKATNWEGTTAENTQYTPSGKGYNWNTIELDKWEEASLQEILNTEYWNSLRDYQKLISPSIWYLGAPNYNQFKNYKVVDYYNIERSNTKGSSQGAISFIGNIGLMYPSDYGYSLNGGINQEVWNEQVQDENKERYKLEAWLYNLSGGEYYEWIISVDSSDANFLRVLTISPNGNIAKDHPSYQQNKLGIRPVFYLDKNVSIFSGTGEKNDPYKIM